MIQEPAPTDKEEPSAPHAALIAMLGLRLAYTTTHLSHSPWSRALQERILNPQMGDFVVMDHAPEAAPDTTIGQLVNVEYWRVDRDWEEPWDEASEGRPCPMDRIWVLRLLDGRTFRWDNATPKALPKRTRATVIMGGLDGPERRATVEEQMASLFRPPHGGFTQRGEALSTLFNKPPPEEA